MLVQGHLKRSQPATNHLHVIRTEGRKGQGREGGGRMGEKKEKKERVQETVTRKKET